MPVMKSWFVAGVCSALVLLPTTGWGAEEIRVGLIGLDTSHVTAFTAILNNAEDKDRVPGARVVAAVKGGSPDIESSITRVDGYTKELTEKWGVQLYDTVEELCQHVDAVMLESVDGRPHLAQALPVIKAGKRLYIDKPMAGSLKDVVEIFRQAEKAGVPIFSASSLRFAKNTLAVRAGSIGQVLEARTSSPCHLEPHHPDLFWYGVHGVESLFTVMGPGCQSVRRGKSDKGLIEVTGTWAGGRKGVFREVENAYEGLAKGEKGEAPVGSYDGYRPLVVEIVKFFQTGVAPVPMQETLEIFAFMEAADLSKNRGGEAVPLTEVLRAAGARPAPPQLRLDAR